GRASRKCSSNVLARSSCTEPAIPCLHRPCAPCMRTVSVHGGGMSDDSKKVVRAKQGAVARWEGEAVRFAIDEGEVDLGSLTFRCAVLDDESRVINGTEFMRAMGIYRSGALSTRRSEEDGVYFPLHLAFKNLRPF